MAQIKKIRSDKIELRSLLKRLDIQGQLPNLADLAMKAEVDTEELGEYDPIGSHFCDGVLVKLGHIDQVHAQVTAPRLRNEIQAAMESLIIQHVEHFSNAGGSLIWISFTPETACDLPYLRADIDRIEKAVREHAKNDWNYRLEDLKAIEVAKIDIARDLCGSFIPHD